MARPPRLEIENGLYHITSRGNERRFIYRDDRDRLAQLATLAQVVSRFHWLCLAYCQMGNHYHLLIRTPIPNLSRGMRQLNGVYAQRFNTRHGRVGHLYQGRFTAILIQQDAHALKAIRYSFRNPVEARICKRADDWRWSSYRATLGLERTPVFLQPDELLRLLSPSRTRARAALRALVEDDDPVAVPLPTNGNILAGDNDFILTHAALIDRHPEIPRNGWQPLRPPLTELLPTTLDDAAILHAYRYYGYRLREIAAHHGVHYATISRRIRRAEAMLQCKT
jgi:putative transposase